ncbi:iron transporter [Candidatus Roizmanbacteria bacterium RIFCSPLOWO2_01_FULL_42_14]|uniref:Iron transporter n=3 Tax=Candidatus Roizmaniibacteriota TaxID=1752723 RepID=A0A1F7JTF2_9BACT|nr:MAG: iron transporter [Candidatus Roizmanbacteria bacterium RIFCSPHIGHO2_12_FULL_42_10]OGK51406.1 MAG: iron transporter [Candidatus Roizmanbacteria bacterium RIFCSPLOWO2_01_FULL_42_14]OGK58878.1 MAG: iron transporter [Candidatus Roizmanbacteria bacterium RIFCSPLOWO2_02_FULL_43_10]
MRMRKKLREFMHILGPGFITGASDDDPSGIGTYSQAGAQFGYQQLWFSGFSLPFSIFIQEICGRIGLVTGKGLAGIIRKYYAKRILYTAVLLLLIANSINIGADLGAMAASAQLVLPLPFVVLLIAMTAITLLLEVFVSYKVYSRYLKYLALSLGAYIVVVFLVKQDWGVVLRSSIIPHFDFSEKYLMNIVALLGTTISPYLFFWQADEEVEEEVAEGKLQSMGRGIPNINTGDIRAMRLDTIIGMTFSNLVMFFIILTTASTLHQNGITTIETADQAAAALAPLAGKWASLIFALGIVGIGLLAVPVLAGSVSYAVSEAFGWREGLYRKFEQAHGFYGVIILATLIGLFINFTPIKPFTMLYYTAIINGLAAPILMVLIMRISSNQIIMGRHTNSRASGIMGWLITVIMSVCALALVGSLVLQRL